MVLYRSPAFNHASSECQSFWLNFEILYSRIKAENPLAMCFTGDFNAHSQFWWSEDDKTDEGTYIDKIFTKLDLSQVLSGPTNFEPHKNPWCIELLVTDPLNIILDRNSSSQNNLL